jgi:hypothetical protein
MTKAELNYRYPDECCGNCTRSYQSSYGDYQCKLFTGFVIDIGAVCNEYEQDTEIHLEEHTITEPVPVDMEARSCTTCMYSFMNNDKPMCIETGKAAIEVCRKYKGVVSDIEDSDNNYNTQPVVDIEEFNYELTGSTEEATDFDTSASCVTCVHSCTRDIDGLPYCGLHQSIIHNTNDYCDGYIDDVSRAVDEAPQEDDQEEGTEEEGTEEMAEVFTDDRDTESQSEDASMEEEQDNYVCDCEHCAHSYFDNNIPRCKLTGDEIEADDNCPNATLAEDFDTTIDIGDLV